MHVDRVMLCFTRKPLLPDCLLENIFTIKIMACELICQATFSDKPNSIQLNPGSNACTGTLNSVSSCYIQFQAEAGVYPLIYYAVKFICCLI